MDGYDVDLGDLWKAGRVWDDYADDLHGAQRRLGAAEHGVSALGPRVAPAAMAFLDTWAEAAAGHARAAQGNADAIASARAEHVAIDAEAAAELARMMPWDLAQALRTELGAGA